MKRGKLDTPRKRKQLKDKDQKLLKHLSGITTSTYANIKDYSRKTKIPRSTIYEILSRLELRGFVKRDFSDNHITKAGRKYLRNNRMKTNPIFKVAECIVCGRRDVIDIHHIDQNRSNNNPSNLIHLCPSHHALIHRKKAHICKEDGKRFYKIKI